MADEGYVLGLIAGVQDAALRKILEDAFRHILREQKFGEPAQHKKATNFGSYYQTSTTAGSTGEFSFQHGMAATPRWAVPVLNLNQQGAQLAPLEVSRVADGKRVYLKTSAGWTNAAVWLLVE